MRKYEVMYIIKPNLSKDKTKETIEVINKVVKDFKGKVLKKDEIGLKDLAYPINKFEKGYYFWFLIEADQTAISEVRRIIGINENIIRSLILKDEK